MRLERANGLDNRKHIYETDHCSGCGELITGEYIELGLPSSDCKEIKHIALCSECSDEAISEGAI